jgi:hypothetical protein
MGEEVRAYLTEFYEEPTSRLEDSLGRELSRWKK